MSYLSTIGMVQNVLLTMQENRRLQNRSSIFYGGVVHRPSSEDPIVVKLEHLRRKLRRQMTQMNGSFAPSTSVDATELVVPFIDLIHSDGCTGVVKASALSALLHFVQTRTITTSSARISPAVNASADAAINCRFEMSDAGSDEVVLHAVLSLVTALLSSKCGSMLTDEVVWGILQAAFSLAFTHHRSLLLQKQSERALKMIMHHVFSRLHIMIESNDSMTTRSPSSSTTTPKSQPAPSALELSKETSKETSKEISPPVDSSSYRPHGLPVAVRLFNFAMQLVDVRHHEDLFTDTTSLSRTKIQLRTRRAQRLGMEMMNTALESGGAHFPQCPALLSIVQEDVCRVMILSCFEKNDDHLLRCSLECFQHLAVHCRMYLKHQIGTFFHKVYLRQLTVAIRATQQKSSSRSRDGAFTNTSSDDDRLQMVLESLADLSSHGWLWVELHANYDCDPSAPDVLAPLCGLLSRCAHPEYVASETTHVVGRIQLTSVHCLLNGMRFLATGPRLLATATSPTANSSYNLSRNDGSSSSNSSTRWSLSSELRVMRERKIQLQHAGELFNAKPKKGVKELEKLGLLEKDGTVEERAAVLGHFLRNTSGLDKTKIGEFIGGGDDEASEQLRKAYVSTFNVDGRSVVSSLRMFLGNFRLPGEAQQIDRILQVR